MPQPESLFTRPTGRRAVGVPPVVPEATPVLGPAPDDTSPVPVVPASAAVLGAADDTSPVPVVPAPTAPLASPATPVTLATAEPASPWAPGSPVGLSARPSELPSGAPRDRADVPGTGVADDGRDRFTAVLLGRSRRGLVVRAAAAASALAVLLTTVIAVAVLERTVTVDVDGQTQQVSFLGSGVSDALAEAGVEVGERDYVSPAVGESVADGGTVTVRYGRPLTVDVDGEERTYWTTGLTVEEAIAALDLRFEGAALSVSRSAPIGRQGLAVAVTTPKDVVLVTAGGEQAFTSTGRTVADVLAEAGVAADGDDRVEPAADTLVTAGLRITHRKVDVATVEEAVEVPAPTRTVETADLFEGETEVQEAGRPGTEAVTWTVTTVDGVEESRAEVSRVVSSEPVERVVLSGTKPRPAGGTSPNVGGDVDSLNWAALAQCESGGNPSIVSSNGLYHGLYQFDARTWQSVGGSGVASDAPADEQTYRAKLLYQQRGDSPWPSCGSRLYT
ncbi:MAG: ubiquitin-like domain-containing protein [Actinomycetales bacterium]